jgi:hypothetical protein
VDGIAWELQISHLNPIEVDTPDGSISGAQGRLFNMGYDVGEINGIWGPKHQKPSSRSAINSGSG